MKKNKKRVLSILLCLMMISALLPISLVAQAADFVVTFDTHGGTPIAPAEVTGSTLAVPANPTRDGFSFAGWYKTEAGARGDAAKTSGGGYAGPLVFAGISASVTYHAKWIASDHTRNVETTNGEKTVTLGFSTFSGVKLIRADGTALTSEELAAYDKSYPIFKDLNKNGALDAYEDWRKPDAERALALSAMLSPAEVAGLMLYSAHQTDWSTSVPTQEQVNFLVNDDLRHVLIAGAGNTADVHATWNNNVQAIVESLGFGIPANNSSDPRHSAAVGVEFYSNNAGTMSIWPNSLGIAATFDPNKMLQFSKVASREYRAFGISTALSPQIDIATDPRWNRTNGTFGEDPKLSSDMAAAYVRGFQGSYKGSPADAGDNTGAWGYDSVNAMIKHFPGGGAGESGRDAHNDLGKYAVYPGNNFQAHLVPFVDGSLSGTQGSIDVATAVMPYYTISNNVDPSGDSLANAFSPYMLDGLLRDKYSFDGVICTDWGVDTGRGWGPSIEDKNTTQRSYDLIMSGVNQFGGQNSSQYILAARDIAVAANKAAEFDSRMAFSAKKLLLNVFQTGLFENPYLNPNKSVEIAKDAESNKTGMDTQVDAIVMLKNKIPDKLLTPTTKVYVPKAANGTYLFTNKDRDGSTAFAYADSPADAALAIVPLNSPTNYGAPDMAFFGGGWYPKNWSAQYPNTPQGEHPYGYFPLTLQYSEYTAVNGRALSLAGDYRDRDPEVSPATLNRTYKDKTITARNLSELQNLLAVKEEMRGKPVITVLNLDNPPVMTEIDAASDLILARFACSDAAVLEILTGRRAPSGMLPLQVPATMAAVEAQYEDMPRDLAQCYKDSENHTYDFGFGLTLVDGAVKVIGTETTDARYTKYVVPAMTRPASQTDNGIAGYVNVTTLSLPVAVLGQPYSAAILTAPPTAADRFTLVRVEQNDAGTAGGIQAGLALGLNGVISGTPTAAGCVQLLVRAETEGKAARICRLNLLVANTAPVVKPDPNALSIELTLSRAKKQVYYDPVAWAGFSALLSSAESVYTRALGFTATQLEIDASASALKTAREALTYSSNPIVTFDLNDGTDSKILRQTGQDGKLSDVPSSTRAGYTLTGWYTTKTPSANPANLTPNVTTNTVFTQDTTVYAVWQAEYKTVTTSDGSKTVTLGYAPASGVKFIKADGANVDPGTYTGADPIFKDLNRNGLLDVYEDWRKTTEERATNLSGLMATADDGVEQMAGLMLYSAHYGVTSVIPTDAQKQYLEKDHLRHVLVTTSYGAAVNARWNNNVQAFCEGVDFGIPANNSSDPRHGTSNSSNVEYYVANSGVSMWPSSLGMAATFDTSLNKLFGKIASTEYRALGISTALSPQIDIATDPRWSRFNGTFGEDPKLASGMSRAYVDGFQTTYGGDGITGAPVAGGWGMQSVNAMMKHWPGGGAGEGGRDAHYNYGKYAVFPGGDWSAHLIPFVDGSLSLQDGTEMATAVMPYYTISYMQTPGSEPNSSGLPGAKLNMGNAYSSYMLNGVLRDAYKFEGVVCTDWNVIGPKTATGGGFDADIAGMIWGVDDHFPDAQDIDLDGSFTNMAKRARLLLDAGVDQFGGLNTVAPIVKAYEYAAAADKPALLSQLKTSAYRLLKNIFRTGLFENAYLAPDVSAATVGKPAFMKSGYEAQLKSQVLLKNKNNLLPLSKTETKVYAPGADAATVTLLKLYFGDANVTTDAAQAAGCNVALVFMNSVSAGGGSRNATAHTNTYTPISLDYKNYTASNARETSVAGEPVRDESGQTTGMENRSYKGLTTNAASAALQQIARLDAAKASGKPVVVAFDISRPSVLGEIEPKADAILLNFASQKSAILDMLTGSTKYGDASGASVSVRPTGMLPMQLPKDMNEVEQQLEDVPRDMACYTDASGQVYDFGYGLTWDGGVTKRVDATINAGYTEYVAGNQTAMTTPVNQGNAASEYSIARRRQVTFDYDYKEASGDRQTKTLIKVVNAGQKVTPADGTRAGFKFDGWFLAGANTPFDFGGTSITADIRLVARYTRSAAFKTIAKVFEYSQDVIAVAIDAGENVSAASLALNTFSVSTTNLNPNNDAVFFSGPREITKAYVNDTAGVAETGKTAGRYIILELKVGFNVPGATTQIYTGGRNHCLIMNYAITQNKPYTLAQSAEDVMNTSLTKAGEINLIVDDFVYGVSDGLNYRLFSPSDTSKKQPLVLWLHGAGESGTNNEAQIRANMGGVGWASPYNQAIRPAYVLAPQSNASWSAAERAKILALITSMIASGKVDPDRVYVAGCSMGGAGTWNIITDQPNFFAAAIMCPASAARTPESLEPLKNLPIWLVNTGNDSWPGIETSYNNLLSIGGNVKYTRFPTGANGYPNDHWVWVRVLSNFYSETYGTDIMSWFFRQSRGAAPVETAGLRDVSTPEQFGAYYFDSAADIKDGARLIIALYDASGALLSYTSNVIVKGVSMTAFIPRNAAGVICRAMVWNGDTVPLEEALILK